MKKKLLLINPVDRSRKGLWINHSSRYPPLVFGIIARLTPPDWEIEVIDENLEVFEFRKADMVAFTAFTSSVNRAYSIAGLYREQKIPTVMGGVHASVLPEEAEQYVDAVVVGDAENVWPEIIKDVENGTLKKRYHKPLASLAGIPLPDHSIFSKSYMFGSVHTTRGCPLNCSFCAVQSVYKGKYYMRPVEEVLADIEQTPWQMIAFIDDNLRGHSQESRERIYAIFEGMIERKLNKIWWSHVSLDVAYDEKFLDLAERSGCKLLFIGIEAEDDEALKEINKKTNLRISGSKYREAIRNIQRHGITVLGAVMYGLDSDTAVRMKHRTRFILRSRIDALQILPLIPFPGTQVFRQLDHEGRLILNDFPKDWYLFDGLEVV
ncbi:MAG: radical SAM protein, partial [Bacteroidota bacterium]